MIIRKAQLTLSGEKSQELVNLPETGMGYQQCTIVLKDGTAHERVPVLNCSVIERVPGVNGIPFEESDISKIIVTHDKN